MTSIKSLTTEQLQRAITIKEEIESLEEKLATITGNSSISKPKTYQARRMSKAGRAAIAAGQKARWAKLRKGGSQPVKEKVPKKRRKMSNAGRAKIAAAAKARWAIAKAAGKSKL
jgi:hypothetical protein